MKKALQICLLAWAGTLCIAALAADGQPPLSLEGTSWQLVAIQDMSDAVFSPDDPAKYTVRFRSEGRLQVESDCNRGGGTWRQDGSSVEFEGVYSTQAMCPPGSLHNRFMMNLNTVRSFVTRDGNLFLATFADGAILEFEPLVFVPVGRPQ
ncbi:MAG: hypothetical protein RLZZ385_2161 [Pseudomonadota bacterium]|jgi:para-nitrobenzyl esterase